MNQPLKSQLEKLLNEFQLEAIVVVRLADLELFHLKKDQAGNDSGLFTILFGGKEQIRNLNQSLEEQILPQIWGQGKMDCLVDKTADGFIFGVFRNPSEDFVSELEQGRRIGNLVKEILENHE